MISTKDKLHSPDLRSAESSVKPASADLSSRLNRADRGILLFTLTCDGETIRKITPERNEALSSSEK